MRALLRYNCVRLSSPFEICAFILRRVSCKSTSSAIHPPMVHVCVKIACLLSAVANLYHVAVDFFFSSRVQPVVYARARDWLPVFINVPRFILDRSRLLLPLSGYPGCEGVFFFGSFFQFVASASFNVGQRRSCVRFRRLLDHRSAMIVPEGLSRWWKI
jgi:hypothetical protein